MKALTLEQLKSLKVGDWVWIKDTGDKDGCILTGYYQIKGYNETHLHLQQGLGVAITPYALYGKWLAYKNKEQAECKGEIVELPSIREVEAVECGMKTTKFQVCFIRKDLPCMNAIDYYIVGIKSEAERRLAELTKEITK